jgi:chromosome partitioning protein
LIAGDFWLNVYADSLNVGGDLLSGTGLSRYVALRKMVEKAESISERAYDFVLVDLPPSFGALVRAAFYSSDYYIVPCTSDNFSVYCLGLIGQMVPSFAGDWQSGLGRFKESNPHFEDFDSLGRPAFAGWVFNGFDTARQRRSADEIEAGTPRGEKLMVQADRTMHGRLVTAVKEDLVDRLRSDVSSFDGVAQISVDNHQIGAIEDANVLIQNSLWLSVPIGQLESHQQVVSLQDRRQWATNQVERIRLIGDGVDQMAEITETICV